MKTATEILMFALKIFIKTPKGAVAATEVPICLSTSASAGGRGLIRDLIKHQFAACDSA